MLREAPADIIICDQIMPDIKGTMFLREAAELCPRSYRILLTGNASVIDVVSEIATGVVQMFISKPWDEGRMLDALERALVEIERK
jgi:DNA-binding NtrC family response regulator